MSLLRATRDKTQAELIAAEGWVMSNRGWLIACAVSFLAGWTVAGWLYH